MIRWIVILVFSLQAVVMLPAVELVAVCCGVVPQAPPVAAAGCCGEGCPCVARTPLPEHDRDIPADVPVRPVVFPVVQLTAAAYVLPELDESDSFPTVPARLTAPTSVERQAVLCVWLT